jgi:hypothetical protein
MTNPPEGIGTRLFLIVDASGVQLARLDCNPYLLADGIKKKSHEIDRSDISWNKFLELVIKEAENKFTKDAWDVWYDCGTHMMMVKGPSSFSAALADMNSDNKMDHFQFFIRPKYVQGENGQTGSE